MNGYIRVSPHVCFSQVYICFWMSIARQFIQNSTVANRNLMSMMWRDHGAAVITCEKSGSFRVRETA